MRECGSRAVVLISRQSCGRHPGRSKEGMDPNDNTNNEDPPADPPPPGDEVLTRAAVEDLVAKALDRYLAPLASHLNPPLSQETGGKLLNVVLAVLAFSPLVG